MEAFLKKGGNERQERTFYPSSAHSSHRLTERPVGFGWFVEFGNIIPVPIVCIFVAVVIYATGQRFKKTASLEARGGMSGRSSINEGEQA